jgi:hypothetical protein
MQLKMEAGVGAVSEEEEEEDVGRSVATAVMLSEKQKTTTRRLRWSTRPLLLLQPLTICTQRKKAVWKAAPGLLL